MDSAIASALEKFIDAPSPSRASRRSRSRRQVSASAERGPSPSTTPAVSTSPPGGSSSGMRRSSPPAPPVAPPPRAPPPTNALSAEHLGSSGQGCRGILACARDGGGWHADHARQSPWTTPRGQDITAVFRLVQRPGLRVVQLGDGEAEELHENLLVTLMVDVPAGVASSSPGVSGSSSSAHDAPLRLRMLRVSSSHHPKQGFVTVVRLTHVAPEVLRHGTEARFQVEIPGTMVAEFLRLEAVNDDPQRMTRFTMVAFSPAPRSTSRRIQSLPPSQHAAVAHESVLSSDVEVEEHDEVDVDTKRPTGNKKNPLSEPERPPSASILSAGGALRTEAEHSTSLKDNNDMRRRTTARPSPSPPTAQVPGSIHQHHPDGDPPKQSDHVARRKPVSPRSSAASVLVEGTSDAARQGSSNAVGSRRVVATDPPPPSHPSEALTAPASGTVKTPSGPPGTPRVRPADGTEAVAVASQTRTAVEASQPTAVSAPPAPLGQLSETRRQALRELITAYTKRRCIETEQLQERNRSLEGEVIRLKEEQQRRGAGEGLDGVADPSRQQRGGLPAASMRQFQDDAALLRCVFESVIARDVPGSVGDEVVVGADDGSFLKTPSVSVGYGVLCTGQGAPALKGATATAHSTFLVDSVANLQRAVGTCVHVWVLMDGSQSLQVPQSCAVLGRSPSLEWWECPLSEEEEGGATCIRCFHPVPAQALSELLQVLGKLQLGPDRHHHHHRSSTSGGREATASSPVSSSAARHAIPTLRLVVDESDTLASCVPVFGSLVPPLSRFLVVLRARSHFSTLLELGTVVGKLSFWPSPSTMSTWRRLRKGRMAAVAAEGTSGEVPFVTWCATVCATLPEFAWRCGAVHSSGPTVVFTTQHPVQCVLRADGAIGNSRFVKRSKELHGGREPSVAMVTCNDLEAMMSVALTTSRRLHWSVVCVVTASRWAPLDDRSVDPGEDSLPVSRLSSLVHLTTSLLDSWMDAVSLCGSSPCPHTVVVCSDDLRIVNGTFLEGFTRLADATEADRH